jgi:hypothetical protein
MVSVEVGPKARKPDARRPPVAASKERWPGAGSASRRKKFRRRAVRATPTSFENRVGGDLSKDFVDDDHMRRLRRLALALGASVA